MDSKNKIKDNENFSSGFYDWAIFLINFYQRINKRLGLDFESFLILQVVVSYNVYLMNKNKKLSLESLSFEFEKSSNAEFLKYISVVYPNTSTPYFNSCFLEKK